MSDKFDAYEYVGLIAPGSVAIFAAALLFPDLRQLTAGPDISVGGLGLFVIMSYVAGHLLQAVGNFVEKVTWWPFGGMPTQWVLKHHEKLLAPQQYEKLFKLVANLYPDFDRTSKSAQTAWVALTREIYARVRKADQSRRIDAFNRNYGLMRGIASGFLIASVMVVFREPTNFEAIGLLLLGTALSIYRMCRFGILYGRELLVTFVTCE